MSVSDAWKKLGEETVWKSPYWEHHKIIFEQPDGKNAMEQGQGHEVQHFGTARQAAEVAPQGDGHERQRHAGTPKAM